MDPKTVLERVRPVLELYENAKEWLKERACIVCSGEKTSIQAGERPDAPQPAMPGHPVHVVALSVADGWVGGLCRQRKRFVDFQAFLLELVIPEALRRGVHTAALVLDNGPTHAPK